MLGALFAVAVANAVLFLALIGETTGWTGAREGAYVAVCTGFAAAFGLLTLVRDRWPRTALIAAVLTVCAYYTVGLPSVGVVLPLLVVLTATTLAGHRTFALITVGALFIVATFFRLRDGEEIASVLGYELLSNLVLVALAVALAEVIGTRRALQRSQEHSTRLAAEAARAEADRVQEADRSRIARELHDELGHSLAIVSLHANAVSERLPVDDPAVESAKHLREAAAQALGQLRRAVRAVGAPVGRAGGGGGVSDAGGAEGAEGPEGAGAEGARGAGRDGPGDGHPVAAERAVTDLRIGGIVDRVRAAGLSVDVVEDHGALPPDVAGAAFRVVQEATTNALRHSSPGHIGIALTDGPAPSSGGPAAPGADGVLRVRILNDGARQEDVPAATDVSATTGTPATADVPATRGVPTATADVPATRDVPTATGVPAATGGGLAGLRARAAQMEFGGQVSWERRDPDLFVVDAEFPLVSGTDTVPHRFDGGVDDEGGPR